MDYYQGYEDAMRQGRVIKSRGLTGLFVRVIISLLYSAFIYVPLLILSYIVSNSMRTFYSDDMYIKTGLTLLAAYGLFASVYFLKGIVIAYRNNSRPSWILYWLICVVATCGVQAIGSQIFLQDFFRARGVANYEVWSWLGSASVAVLIYSHYRFLTNVAPGSVFWSYNLGFKLANAVGHINVNSKFAPIKSAHYFENAPMKVSFKR